MSTISGVFSETLLRDLRVKADELMFDDRIKQQFIPQIEILNAIRSVQTAQVTPKFQQIKDSQGKSKKYDVEVMWENACEIVVEECGVCDNAGDKLSTNAQIYGLEFCKQVPFTVSEYDYLDNEFDWSTSIAKGLLKADKELAEALAIYAVSVLNSNKGINQMGTGSKGVVSGSDTYVEAAYWDAKLMAYFMRVAQLNRFTSPTLLSGANLFEDYFIINKMQGDSNGKGNQALMGTFPLFFDIFNIDTVNTPALITYLLSMGSVAIANRTYNPSSMEFIGANATNLDKRWTVPSKFVPGISYDAFYDAECDNDMVAHNFRLKLTADILVNPEGCEANNTGILTFICGEPD